MTINDGGLIVDLSKQNVKYPSRTTKVFCGSQCILVKFHSFFEGMWSALLIRNNWPSPVMKPLLYFHWLCISSAHFDTIWRDSNMYAFLLPLPTTSVDINEHYFFRVRDFYFRPLQHRYFQIPTGNVIILIETLLKIPNNPLDLIFAQFQFQI